jgi:hypothetical protein
MTDRSDLSPKMRRLVSRVEIVVNVAVRAKTCITYTQLAEDLGGYLPRSIWVATALGRLVEEDFKNGKPLRSAIVVRKDSGMPGAGFYEKLEEVCGNPIGDRNYFWRDTIRKLCGNHVTIPV